MASRYWVGGSASWDSTAGSKWSTTSGGSGGAAVPTSSDSVFFDSNSGAVTVTCATGGGACGNADFTGFTGTFAGTANTFAPSGNLTLAASMTLALTGNITFGATGPATITTNGVALSSMLIFDGVGGSWTLQEALTTSGAITLTQGALAFGGHAVTCSSLATSNSNTRTLDLTNSTLTLTGSGTAFTCSTSTGLTLISAGSEIIATDTSGTAKVLTLDGETYNKITFSGAGPLTLNATGTIARLTIGASTTSVDTTGFTINALDFTSFVGTWTSNPNLTLTGDLLLNIGMTVSGLTGTLTLSGSASRLLSTAGIALQCGITIDCAGGTVTCAGDVATAQGKILLLKNGVFDAAGFNVTAGFVDTTGSTNARTLSMGSGTWSLNPGETGSTTPWVTTPTTNLAINGGTSTIHMQNATAGKTFDGGGFTYGDLTCDGSGSGVLTITGSNTFRNLSISGHDLSLAAGTTQTVATFSAMGSSGALLNLKSSTGGTQATLSCPANRQTSHFVNVKDVVATGGAFWFLGRNSTNGGNTRGWRFMTAAARSGICGVIAV